MRQVVAVLEHGSAFAGPWAAALATKHENVRRQVTARLHRSQRAELFRLAAATANR